MPEERIPMQQLNKLQNTARQGKNTNYSYRTLLLSNNIYTKRIPNTVPRRQNPEQQRFGVGADHLLALFEVDQRPPSGLWALWAHTADTQAILLFLFFTSLSLQSLQFPFQEPFDFLCVCYSFLTSCSLNSSVINQSFVQFY